MFKIKIYCTIFAIVPLSLLLQIFPIFDYSFVIQQKCNVVEKFNEKICRF